MNYSSSSLHPNFLKLIPEKERKKLGKAGILPSEAAQVVEAKTEKLLQCQLEGLLRRHGIVCCRQRMDRKSNIAIGWPDLTFAIRGNAIAWEVKLPGKDPDTDQVKMHAQMRDNGWTVMVIRSYAEGLEFLRAIGVQ